LNRRDLLWSRCYAALARATEQQVGASGKQPSLWQDLQALQLGRERQPPVKADELQGPCHMIVNQQRRAKLTCIGGANRMSRQ